MLFRSPFSCLPYFCLLILNYCRGLQAKEGGTPQFPSPVRDRILGGTTLINAGLTGKIPRMSRILLLLPLTPALRCISPASEAPPGSSADTVASALLHCGHSAGTQILAIPQRPHIRVHTGLRGRFRQLPIKASHHRLSLCNAPLPY